ncbi:MAG: PAS domain-containing protein [Sulfobacillus thermosulfidooxidans]|uniref:HTH luxR-type domain-containing protein n=1 Tax=Sulfobacillus thermotolerans TaxID=338644 RepID=A0ABM6RR15_9FIRM|nr:sigma factor-like helix-turn-helix DNA-binding protein [Sulfobacillus sp. hq2]AUW93848.1 hypothetical protein BXT84_07745 [Sulfobacillus thermotolerans]MCY0908919.1 LuxR C-terminal-related transcriptional regulator [Sulfobacillus thermotolerans]POB11338.1 hypothetical protein CO251_05350 [Sulfobacillus sp. hq2]PSR35960.1 MAG: PAS domain-containing protein [Sulfobacillus thermosulfidooxidans]
MWSNGACFIVNNDLAIEHWNPAISQMTGLSEEAVLGRRCYDVIRGANLDGSVFCQASCTLLTTGTVPSNILVPTRYTGHRIAELRVTMLDTPPVIVHWLTLSDQVVSPTWHLTPRQQAIFALRSQGYSRAAIAKELHIQLSTVNTHIKRVREILGVRTEQEALAQIAASASSSPTARNE